MMAAHFVFSLPLVLAQLAPMERPDEIFAIAVEQKNHLETRHYILHMEGAEQELEKEGELIEAAFEAFGKTLGEKPRVKRGKKTTIRIFKDEFEWRAGLDLEQQLPPPRTMFMYYSPEAKTVYLYGEPGAYGTRKWLLYGLFQDFHRNVKAKNRDLEYEWYVTGMADTLSTHHWDGEKLSLAVRKALPINNRARHAIYQRVIPKIEDGEISLDDLFEWDVRWAVTAFLMFGEKGRYRKKFNRLALGSTGSMVVGFDLLPLMGNAEQIMAEMTAWLEERARCFKPRTGEWNEDGDALQGASGYQAYALATADEQVNFLELRVLSSRSVRRGVVLDWTDEDHFVTAGIHGDELVIERHDTGQVIFVSDSLVKLDRDGRCKITLERKGHDILLKATGMKTIKIPVKTKTFGLFVGEGSADFEDLRWR